MKTEELNEWLGLTQPHPNPGIHISPQSLHEHPLFQNLVKKVEDAYGVVSRLRVLVMEPGSAALKPHRHRADSIVYYPYDHAIGLSSDKVSRAGVKADSFLRIPSTLKHYVGPNVTDEPRVSVVMEINDPYFKMGHTKGCEKCKEWRAKMPKIIRDFMDKRWPL